MRSNVGLNIVGVITNMVITASTTNGVKRTREKGLETEEGTKSFLGGVITNTVITASTINGVKRTRENGFETKEGTKSLFRMKVNNISALVRGVTKEHIILKKGSKINFVS